MTKVKTFAAGAERWWITIQGIEMEIAVDEHIFPPSRNGSFYAENIRVRSGETVLDVGTGSGVLAIFAAKSGATVSATDTDQHAIEVATQNAALNGATVNWGCGSLFGPFTEVFDVILANLPNEIVASDYLQEVGAERAQTFDGGKRGNQHLLDLLAVAKNHMHAKSRLYLPVHTLTDYHQTMREAILNYEARLIAVGDLPTKEFVAENLDFYLALNAEGTIRIFQRGDTWYSNGYVFELTRK